MACPAGGCKGHSGTCKGDCGSLWICDEKYGYYSCGAYND